MLKNILHTGIEVDDIKTAVKFYEGIGYTLVDQFAKPEPKAKVAVVRKNDSSFELWQFEDQDHPYVEFVRNHMAVYSDDIEKDVETLVRQRGYKLTIPITDGVRLRYAYVQGPNGQNYEIATEKS